MQIRIGELKARASRGHTRLTWDDIETATGIRKQSLIAMNNGSAKQIRPEHLDALGKFFEVGVNDLLEFEDVTLPLQINVRPDRRKAQR